MAKIKDRTGEIYGHWIVKEQDIEKSLQTKKIHWICECDCGCGTIKSIRADALSQITIGGCDNLSSIKSKKCIKCGQEFFPKKQAKTRRYCYKCIPEENYNGSSVLRKKIKIWALEYKDGKCQKCGYNKCPDALEFHHLNPDKKDFSLSDRNLSLDWENIKKELDKCILICANCHRELHAQEKGE